MKALVQRHPLLQKFYEARKGEALTTPLFLANRALLSVGRIGEPFTINTLQLSLTNKVDSIAISKMLGWWLEAGYLEEIQGTSETRKYQFTTDFCVLFGA